MDGTQVFMAVVVLIMAPILVFAGWSRLRRFARMDEREHLGDVDD